MVEENGFKKGVILIWSSPLAPLNKGGTGSTQSQPLLPLIRGTRVFLKVPLITRSPEEKKYFPKHLTDSRRYGTVVIRDQCGTGGIGRRA